MLGLGSPSHRRNCRARSLPAWSSPAWPRSGEIFIRRPVEEVFDFVADERNEPRYNPRMLSAEKVSADPIGIGTRFHAEMRGRRKPIEMTIELPATSDHVSSHPAQRWRAWGIRGSLKFDPARNGTSMRWQWNLVPGGLLKALSPMIVYMGRRQEQAIWSELKRLLEAPTADRALARYAVTGAPASPAWPLPPSAPAACSSRRTRSGARARSWP